jgi:hypothetical protein
MSKLLVDYCNRIGSISGKTKCESGYSFDADEECVDAVKITYLEGSRDVKWESNEKMYREKRNARRRELYPNTSEVKNSKRREKYKINRDKKREEE